MKNIFCILICHFYCISKLIGSNTLQEISSIQLHEYDINLTVWIQARFPLKFQDKQKLESLKIIDQENNDQVIINLVIFEENMMGLNFRLQNKSIQTKEISRENSNVWNLEWQKITINRDLCFNKLQYFDFNMSVTCTIQFNATLIIFQSNSFHLYVYDTEEFINEEIILLSNFLIESKYNINTIRNDLQINFYAKLFCCGQENNRFFEFELWKNVYLYYQYNLTKIEIIIGDYQRQNIYGIKKLEISSDQWVFFNMKFEELNIIIQCNMNNTNNKFVVQIDHYLDVTNSIYLNFQFKTYFKLRNSNTIVIQYLQIISLVASEDHNSCSKNCQFCLYSQCLDKKNTLDSVNISKEIRSSVYYNENYFKHYKLEYNDQKNENPTYKGQYCYNCDILQKSIIYLDDYDYLGVRTNSYDYYLENLYEASDEEKQENNGLFYENDLNLFIMKGKDIYLAYYLSNNVYCENGYSFVHKCQKILKNSYYTQFPSGFVCQQQYALQNNKCIRCQQNCLYCKIIKKKIVCILYVNNYYQDDLGLIKQCTNDSYILNCLPKEQAIQEILQKGHKVCQPQQVFDIKQKKCLEITYYKQIFTYLQYYHIQNKYQSQYLEIQDIIEQSYLLDYQIQGLISLQQVSKLYELVQQWNKNQMNKNFDILSQLNCSVEEISIKKITLHEVKIFLAEKPIIIYENTSYEYLIDIFDQLSIQPKIIQFDIILTFLSIEKQNLSHIFEIVYINYDTNFIFNISFNFNPSILYKYANQLHFRANQIIIQNLVFDQIIEHFEDPQLIYTVLNLQSDKLIISNIIIQNIKLEQVIFLEDFNDLRIQNISIINSSVDSFIRGWRIIQHQHMVQISDIYCQSSNLTNFIKFQNAESINISQILYISSQLNGYNFQFSGSINYIQIQNFQLIKVQIVNTKLLEVKYSNKQEITKFYMSNLYVQGTNVTSSNFFYIQNVTQIQFQYFYLHNSTFQESYFINIYNNQFVYISSIFICQVNIKNYFPLLSNKGFDQYILEDIYINNLHSTKQRLFFIQGKIIIVNNLNFNQIEASVNELIIIQSLETQILNLMMQNLIFNAYGFTISIFSDYCLNIQGIVFKSAQLLIGIQLFQLTTIYQCFVKYLYICDLNIITSNMDQLMLFQNAGNRNSIQFVYLKSINIETQDKNYTFFQFANSKVQVKFTILHLSMKNIKNQSPAKSICIISTDYSQMWVTNVNIINTHSISFLQSSSSILVMEYFYINYIFRQFIDYESFIIHKSPQLVYKNETIQINHFQVMNLQGIFITVNTENFMYVILNDFNFIKPRTTFEFFQFISISVEIYTQLLLNRIQIIHQINAQEQSQQAFILTNFDNIIISQVYVEDLSKQFLKAFQCRKIQIVDVYISQYHLDDTALLFQLQQFTSSIIISNFIIYNSSISKGSIFDFILKEQNLKIDNIKFINVAVKNSAIKLVSTSDTPIKLSEIVLKGVVSDQFLFHIKSETNYFSASIIKGQSTQIFSGDNKKIGFINGLITDIEKNCLLSQNTQIFLNQSEVVNSNIIQHQDQIIKHKSNYLGMITNFNQNIIIFLSLNEGKSLFNQIQIQENLYQVQFSQNNSYLYLPSGRDIYEYQYFNYRKRQYTKIYDSISFISLYQAQTTQCTLSQNFNNQTIYKQDLVLQPGVNRINNLTFTLNPYYRDKFIELNLICNQNESKITYRTLIKTFNCQLGEFLFQDQCILCDIKQYLYSVGYNQQYCLQKDQNTIEKLNIGQIKLYKTFWRHSYANKYIEQCKNQNCLGGWQTGDHSCKTGYVGALCSECDVYNVRGQGSFGQIDNQCTLCYFDYSIYLKGLLIIMVQLLLIFLSQNTNQQLSQQFLFMRISKRKFTDILQRQNINQVTILFKLYYNYLFTIYLLKEWINFGQFIDLSLNVLYNPSFIAVPQFDCLIYSFFQYPVQYTQLVIKILLPISLLNFIVIIYAFMIKFQVQKYSIYVIIVCLLIIHQQHQQVILQSLIKLLSPIKYSSIYWTLENLNIEYYSKIHQYYLLVLIIPLIILITIINIAIFMWIKYINKRIFVHLKLSLFIYKQYKNQFYYWEYFRLAFIYLYMLILYRYDSTYIILLTIFIITISHIYKPFELQNINQIDQIIYIISLYTYFGILIHQKDDTSNKFIIIVFSNIILVKLFLKYFMHSLNIQYRQQKIQYLNQMIKYMPKLGTYINTQSYDKNEYYYNLLKQSRKQKTAMNTIVQSTISIVSKVGPSVQAEVEMTEIQNKE